MGVEGHLWDSHFFGLLQNIFVSTHLFKLVSGIKLECKFKLVLGNQTVSRGIPMPWGLIAYIAVLLEWPLAFLWPQSTFQTVLCIVQGTAGPKAIHIKQKEYSPHCFKR